jgi:hypothetical protein
LNKLPSSFLISWVLLQHSTFRRVIHKIFPGTEPQLRIQKLPSTSFYFFLTIEKCMFEQQSYEGDCSLIPFGSSPGHKLGACCACSKLAGELSQGITFPDYPFSDRYFANFFQPTYRKIKRKLAVQPD